MATANAAIDEVTSLRLRIEKAVLDHPVLAIFLLALSVRVFISVFLTSVFSGSLVLDDSTYHVMANDIALDRTETWDAQTHLLYRLTGAFLFPLSVIYRLFGPVPILGQLFVVLLGSVAAAFVTRLALEFLRPRFALVAGLVVAVLPSQALWSSLLMKDAAVWFALTGLALAIVLASNASGWRLFLLGIAVVALLVDLAFLREHSLVVASWALMIAGVAGAAKERVPVAVGALLIGVLVPYAVGIGPAGFSLVTNAGSLEERRLNNAQNANTAVVDPPEATFQENLEVLKARRAALLNQAETLEKEGETQKARALRARADHIGALIEGDGTGGPAVPAEGPDGTGGPAAPAEGPDGTGGPGGPAAPAEGLLNPNLLYLPKGLVVMLLEPFPVPFSGSLSLRLARLESLIWYPILLLAVVGLFGIRGRLRSLLFPLASGGGILLTYALTEGNVGTAHRHRGEFVWVVALLAGLGLNRLLGSPSIEDDTHDSPRT